MSTSSEELGRYLHEHIWYTTQSRVGKGRRTVLVCKCGMEFIDSTKHSEHVANIAILHGAST